MNFSPAVELGLLLFFGLCGALYLVGRGRSFLLQYQSIEAKIEAERVRESEKIALKQDESKWKRDHRSSEN